MMRKQYQILKWRRGENKINTYNNYPIAIFNFDTFDILTIFLVARMICLSDYHDSFFIVAHGNKKTY